MKSKMLTRIVFGAIMISVLAGLGSLEYWLDQQNAPYYETLEWRCSEGNMPTLVVNTPPGVPIFLPKLPTVIVIALVAILAFGELNKLATASGTPLLTITALIWAVLLATENYWKMDLVTALPSRHWRGLFYTLLFSPPLFCLLMLVLEQMIRYRISDALRRMGATFFAICYLGYLLGCVYDIRNCGVPYLVLFLAAVKCTDIGAYFTGSAIGKHKLIPWLSPGKSWEGLIGGLVTAAAVSMFVVWCFPSLKSEITMLEAVIFGVVIGLVGQFGDLCESLLKRSANIKDAGSKVPEFGGVLDIIDSPLVAAPFAWLLFYIMG
jgi:phosphatidate cytidylyltransferase